MKITKLMLSALVAAAALVSCNKEDLDPETTGLKTVKISLENPIMTKGEATNQIANNTTVKVNNFKIILTDKNFSKEYKAYSNNGTETTTYYNGVPSEEISLHLVSPECTKVLVVANYKEQDFSLDQLVGINNVGIDTQQDPTKLILIGSSDLERVVDESETHTVDGKTKYTEVYSATVPISPLISRFEIDGFKINFNKNNFSTISITDVGFFNFYNSATYANGTFVPNYSDYFPQPPTGKQEFDMNDQLAVFNYFTDNKNSWFVDSVESESVKLTSSSNTKVLDTKLAYHFYSQETTVPTMVIKLKAGEGSGAQPAYVYTKNFKMSDNSNLTVLEAGKIYRMTTDFTVSGGDGIVEIPDNIDPLDRCIDVRVTVKPWIVTLVKPEF